MSRWWRWQAGGLSSEDRDALTVIPGVRVGADTIAAPENAAWLVGQIVSSRNIGAIVHPPRATKPRDARLALPLLREWVPAFLTPYQRAGVLASLQWPDESGMFVWPAGSGKTLGSIVWALSAGPKITIAVTKAAVRPQWTKQVSRFSFVPAIELEGTNPVLPPLPPPPFVLVISYQILPAWIETLEKIKPHSLILDESHLVQSHKRWSAQVDLVTPPQLGELTVIEGGESAPTPDVKVNFSLNDNIAAAAYRLSRCSKRRLATTATPIRDRVRNLWAQLDLVRPWEWGSFYAFARRYCAAAEGSFGGIDTRGASNLDELKKRLSFVSHRVPFSVANAELPPKRRQTVYVQVKDQVKPEAIADDLRRAARLGPTAMLEMRIMEAASRKRRIASEYACDALAAGQKVVVFTGRRKDVAALDKTIRAKLRSGPNYGKNDPTSYFVGDGSLDVGVRSRMCEDFLAAPAPAILIGTGDAFGEGLDLQDADLLINAMLPYTPAAIIQREGRVARLGQKRPVLVLYLICEGTVDEHVAAILLNKLPAVARTLDQDEIDGLGRELIGASEEELLASLIAKVVGRNTAEEPA